MKNKNIYSCVIITVFLVTTYFVTYISNKQSEQTCINTAYNFLSWYKNNFNSISEAQNNIALIRNVEYYKVDNKAVDNYINLLKSSSYISDNFLNKLIAYIKKSDLNLQKIKQTDGPPEGFDYEFILGGQEYEYLLEKIPQDLEIKLENTHDNQKILLINGHLKYFFNNNCKLENIGRNDQLFY